MLHQVIFFIWESASLGPGRLGGHFPSYGLAPWHRCVLINFLLRIDNLRAGAWYSCFPINFLSRIDVLRAWDIERPFSRIWTSLSGTEQYHVSLGKASFTEASVQCLSKIHGASVKNIKKPCSARPTMLSCSVVQHQWYCTVRVMISLFFSLSTVHPVYICIYIYIYICKHHQVLSIRHCTKHFAPLPNTRFQVSWAVVDVDLDMTCLLFSVIDFVLLSAGGGGWECS